MAKVLPEANFINLVGKYMTQKTPDAIQQRRNTEEVLAVISAARSAQPTDDSDNFPFYQQGEQE